MGIISDVVCVILGSAIMCFVLWSAHTNITARDWEEYKDRESFKEDHFKESTFTRLTVISQSLAGLASGLASIENEVDATNNDLEALRRKLHEMSQDIKSIKSVFAVIPTADAVND